jgi:hypothetical protein
MDKSSIEALIRWLEIWSAIFGVIVVVGVAGESFFGIRLLWNNWKLQRLQTVESGTLKVELARLANESEKDKLEIMKAHRGAEEAKRDAAVANLELEKLKAPRVLSAGQLATLIAELKPFASRPTPFKNPMNRIDVFALLSHGEVNGLRDQIVSALRRAGWDARPNMNRRVSASHIVEGVVVEIYSGTSEDTRDRAIALVKALTDAGLKTVGPVYSQNLAGDARIEILIGNKP